MKFRSRLVPPPLCRAGRSLRRLLTACDGAEAIEFALLAIPLLMFLVGVVEFARLYWIQSELQYAAESTARCATLVNLSNPNPASCNGTSVSDNTGLKSYAAAQLLGTPITSSDLGNFQVNAAKCGNQVSFTYNFNFLVGALMPNNAITLQAIGCHQA